MEQSRINQDSEKDLSRDEKIQASRATQESEPEFRVETILYTDDGYISAKISSRPESAHVTIWKGDLNMKNVKSVSINMTSKQLKQFGEALVELVDLPF